MKTLKIGTKRNGEKLITESLFNPINGKTLNREKYSSGKYALRNYKGMEMEVDESVHALWVEKGEDEHGSYATLMCACEA